jgi:hypothetical protein
VGGGSVTKTDGFGNFTPCSVPAGTTMRYGIEVPFQGRTAAQTGAQFASALEQDFTRAGYRLTASGNAFTTRKGGVRVTLKPLGSVQSGPMASLTVVTDCFNAGNAATGILQHYGGAHSDHYRASQASASPLPTGFPWDSGQSTKG